MRLFGKKTADTDATQTASVSTDKSVYSSVTGSVSMPNKKHKVFWVFLIVIALVAICTALTVYVFHSESRNKQAKEQQQVFELLPC